MYVLIMKQNKNKIEKDRKKQKSYIITMEA